MNVAEIFAAAREAEEACIQAVKLKCNPRKASEAADAVDGARAQYAICLSNMGDVLKLPAEARWQDPFSAALGPKLRKLSGAGADNLDEMLASAGLRKRPAQNGPESGFLAMVPHLPWLDCIQEQLQDLGTDGEDAAANYLMSLLRCEMLLKSVDMDDSAFRERFGLTQKNIKFVFASKLGKSVPLSAALLAEMARLLHVRFALLQCASDSRDLTDSSRSPLSVTFLPDDAVDADAAAVDTAAGSGPSTSSAAAAAAGGSAGSTAAPPTPLIPLLEMATDRRRCFWQLLVADPDRAGASTMTDHAQLQSVMVPLPHPANAEVPMEKLLHKWYQHQDAPNYVWHVERRGVNKDEFWLSRMVVTHSRTEPDMTFMDVCVHKLVRGHVQALPTPALVAATASAAGAAGAAAVASGAGQFDGGIKEEEATAAADTADAVAAAAAPSSAAAPSNGGLSAVAATTTGSGGSVPAAVGGGDGGGGPSSSTGGTAAAAGTALGVNTAADGLSALLLADPNLAELGKDQAGKSLQGLTAGDKAKELRDAARPFARPRKYRVDVILLGPPGTGKSLIGNNLIASTVATREQLQQALPPESWEAVEVPARCDDYFDKFLVSREPLPPDDLTAAADAELYSEGGTYDYFRLQDQEAEPGVQDMLRRGWDEQPHLHGLGIRYNDCKPRDFRAEGQVGEEYSCFMAVGRGANHCTDALQIVDMPPVQPGDPDSAAFKAVVRYPSRATINRYIHQYRKYVMGELPFNQVISYAHIRVPGICGLQSDRRLAEEFERKLQAALANGDMDEDDEYSEEEREQARAWLLKRLYPLKRYEQFLGHKLTFQVCTADARGAAEWAEYFSTHLVLGPENTAFSIGSQMTVPSGSFHLRVQDVPGLTNIRSGQERTDRDVLQAMEFDRVIGTIPESDADHVILCLPQINRSERTARQAISKKLLQSGIHEHAILNPDRVTYLVMDNLRAGNNSVNELMETATSGAEFVQGVEMMSEGDVARFWADELMTVARLIGKEQRGLIREVRSLIDRGSIVSGLSVDVSGRLMSRAATAAASEAGGRQAYVPKDFVTDPAVQEWRFTRVVKLVTERYNKTAAALEVEARRELLEKACSFALEGLVVGMQVARGRQASAMDSPVGGDGADNDNHDEGGDEESTVKQRKASLFHNVRQVLGLGNKVKVGSAAWLAELRKMPAGAGGAAGRGGGGGGGGDVIGGLPLVVDNLPSYLRGELRLLAHECTADSVDMALEEDDDCKAYVRAYSRLLGIHLKDPEPISDTHLHVLLLNRLVMGGPTVVRNCITTFVERVITRDTEHVLRRFSDAVQGQANADDGDVDGMSSKVLVGLLEESLAGLLKAVKRTVMRTRMNKYLKGPRALHGGTVKPLPVVWANAYEDAEIIESLKALGGRRLSNRQRIEALKSSIQDRWKMAVVGGVSDNVAPLVWRVLGLYFNERETKLAQVVNQARKRVVTNPGPNTLRTVRAALATAQALVRFVDASPGLLAELRPVLKDLTGARTEFLGMKLANNCELDGLSIIRLAAVDEGLRAAVAPAGGGSAGIKSPGGGAKRGAEPSSAKKTPAKRQRTTSE